MKKSLIALALMGAFSGAAFAQSNVTLYGILDVNYQRNDPNGPQASTDGINGGHQSGNRFGIRGSESLGGGMSAIFTLEQGFNIDTGEPSSSRAFHRQAWAGLQFDNAKVGIVAGRIALLSSGTGSFDLFGFTDPFLTGFGDSGLQNTFSSASATRADNTVAIVGGPWAGFKAGVTYSFNIAGAESSNSNANTSAMGFGAQYAMGPFMAAVTYDQLDVAGATSDQKHWQFGLTWDFKIVKLHGGYAMEDNIRAIGTANSGTVGRDADAFMVGVTVPLFGGNLLASYQDRDADLVTGETGDGPDLTVYAVAYTYPLSRRTNLYANFSNRDGGGSNANNATWDRKQFTVGMRHLF